MAVGGGNDNMLGVFHALVIADNRQTQAFGSLVTQHKKKVVFHLVNGLCKAMMEVFGYDDFLLFHIFGANLQLFFKLSNLFLVKILKIHQHCFIHETFSTLFCSSLDCSNKYGPAPGKGQSDRE
jgi:hypothetical protein